MKRVAVLTDFLSYDPAYSLCQGARSNIKMLLMGGYKPLLLVRKGFNVGKYRTDYENVEIAILDPGKTGSNRVEVTEESEEEIRRLTIQLGEVLADRDVVLTHDTIYQANQWKYHVAARRLIKERPDLRWTHWVHSASNLRTAEKTGPFQRELSGKFPNSRLVVLAPELVNIMGARFGYEMDEVVVVPHPIDFTEDFHPLAKAVIEQADLWKADIIATYPCRLDRGKRPHLVIEIFAELCRMGYDARVVICDFHSTAGDKVAYRKEMKKQATATGVPVFFTSDVPEARMRMPHKAVLDLMEFGDILVQPSVSEAYSRVVVEAAWKRCGLVLNMDLPAFKQYDGRVLCCSFSSHDKMQHGEYMRHVAAGIAYQMQHTPMLALHAMIRKERNLKATWERCLWPVIEGDW